MLGQFSRNRYFAIILFIPVVATLLSLHSVNDEFRRVLASSEVVQITDRNGVPLSASYQTAWNTSDQLSLYEVPSFLTQSFLLSEDRRFMNHHGVDWSARLAGLWQNIKAGERLRGSSTMTEQVVRMLHPRPRNLWSKWMEGIEAMLLETSVSKFDILEFYLNQVPYASGRRGVRQASNYYFGRDISTLTRQEMLALVVLARAPSGYDLYRNPQKINAPLIRLAAELKRKGVISSIELAHINSEKLLVSQGADKDIYAQHFVRFVRHSGEYPDSHVKLTTTLDASLQAQVQAIIDRRVTDLSARNVHNGAAVVMDYETSEILAWVVAGAPNSATTAGDIDAVTTPRQPGSAMKPFLYARALDKDWTAATLLNDAPLAEAVGTGLHRFHNYSLTNYGPITLREALGNSLNIPALLTIRHVGVKDYLGHLREMGFNSLSRGSDIYDEGLALGNGEVTLLEMVGGYAALANDGHYKPPRFIRYADAPHSAKEVFSSEAVSIIGNILSDPWARRLEFGRDSVLNFGQQTAVKTGTSTDYRDAWVFGYNDKYVVGIWMGNLDRSPMNEVTGSTGPALAMRSIMTILNYNRETKKLPLSSHVAWHEVCVRPATKDADCPRRSELFVIGRKDFPKTNDEEEGGRQLELIRPTEGLQIAYDPRIPDDHQKFRFEVSGLNEGDRLEWILNGQNLGQTIEGKFLWSVVRGKYSLAVNIKGVTGGLRSLPKVNFVVK